jgi:PilZ domain-containing protein
LCGWKAFIHTKTVTILNSYDLELTTMTWALHSSLKTLVDEAVRTADRRRTRRVVMPLKIRYLTKTREEHRGRILNISACGALVRALPGTSYGDRLIIYIDKLGRFSGEVVRIERDGFAIKFDTRKKRTCRTADTLTWLINGGENDFNRRRAQRIRQNKSAVAILPDGSQRPCKILDISMTGASLLITPKPVIGTQLKVGRMRAEVMRHHDKGIGVQFLQPQKPQTSANL